MEEIDYGIVEKVVDDQTIAFEVPAFAGNAHDIVNRYGLDAVVKAYVTAKFPGQTINKMLAAGQSAQDVQDWLQDWAPGSRARRSPTDRLLAEAERLGLTEEIQQLLRAKHSGSSNSGAEQAAA